MHNDIVVVVFEWRAYDPVACESDDFGWTAVLDEAKLIAIDMNDAFDVCCSFVGMRSQLHHDRLGFRHACHLVGQDENGVEKRG